MTGALWLMAIAFAGYGALVLAAGDRRRVLNFVEYARVADVAGLHREIGRRLLLTAAACAVWAALATVFPARSLVWLLLAVATVVVALCALMAGAERFVDRRNRPG